MELNLIEIDLWVVAQQIGGSAAEFCKGLDAGETAAHHNSGQQSLTQLGALWKGCCALKVSNQAVANLDGLFNGLHADCVLGNALDRESSSYCTRGHDDVVVIQIHWLATFDGDGCLAGLVVHLGELAGDQGGLF